MADKKKDKNYWTRRAEQVHEGHPTVLDNFRSSENKLFYRCCVSSYRKLLMGTYGFRDGKPACMDHAEL